MYTPRQLRWRTSHNDKRATVHTYNDRGATRIYAYILTIHKPQRQDDDDPVGEKYTDGDTITWRYKALHTSDNTNAQNYTPTNGTASPSPATKTSKYFHTIRAHLQRTLNGTQFQT